jgi:hypothetical protein
MNNLMGSSIFSWEQQGRQRGVRKQGDGPTMVGGGTVQPAGPREHGPTPAKRTVLKALPWGGREAKQGPNVEGPRHGGTLKNVGIF